MTNHSLGKRGEQQAIHYLQRKNFRLQAHNMRFGKTEIDLIATHRNTLVFIEVKMRSTHAFGHPETFVSDPQKERYHQAATDYTQRIGWEGPIRFDIIAIEQHPLPGQPHLTHFQDAF